MAVPSFIFGGNTGETQDTLARKRKVAEALMVKGSIAPKNVGEGLSAIGNALLYRSLMKKIDGGEKETADNAAMDYNALFGGGSPAVTPGKTGSNMPKVDSAGNVAPVDIAGGDVFTPFMDTVKTGVQNPYALAAIAATGNAESKFSPGNVNRTWSDPSESGQPGTAGGIMSWRGPRYQALAATGDLTPTGQAKFFLQENPQLIEALNKAGSVEEAQSLMNKAWAFAGHDRPGGEAQRRLDAANAYLPQFSGQKPTEVASLDPSAGIPDTAANAIEAQAPGGMGSPLTEQSFNDRFGQANIPAEIAQGREGLATALTDSRAIQPAQLPVDGASLADEAAAFRQTPEYAAQFPGQGATPDPRVAAALANPQAASQAALPVIPQADTAQQPQVNPQVAQALMAGDQSGVGIGGAEPQGGYFPAQPNAAAQSGPSMQQLMQAAANPNLNDGQRAVVNALLQRKMETDQRASDPSVALDTEYKRAQIDALKAKPGKQWQKLTDTILFNPETGETKDISATPAGGKKAFRFGGSSVEAQSLNGLMDAGQLTEDQAQQLGAGKTITGPNGEVIFMTPQGVFGQPANGGQPQPLSGNVDAGSKETPVQPAQQPSAQDGNIQITDPKVTLDERKAQTFADRLVTSGDLIDEFGDIGTDKSEVMKSSVPFGLGNMLVGEKFQKFDQARRDFINAQLRRESGAVISPEEFDNANKQYFPQPGDTPEVLLQKADNRRVAIEGMVRDGGPTYQRPAAKKQGGDATPQKRRKFNPATGELE